MKKILFTLICIYCCAEVMAQVQKTYSLAASKTRFRASSIVLNKHGKLFIGYNAINTSSVFIGLQVLDTVTGSNQTYDTSNTAMPIGAVNTLEVQDDILWMGTMNGLIRWNTITDTWGRFDRNNSPLKSDSIFSIRLSPDSTLLIGTAKGFFTYKAGNWAEFNTQNSLLVSDWINAVACETNGRIWLGSPGGLFSKQNNNWTVYNQSNSAMKFDSIQNIFIGKNNKVWVHTRVYNPQKDSIKYESYSQIWYLHQGDFKNYFRERGEELKQVLSPGESGFYALNFTLDEKGELYGLNYYNMGYPPQNTFIYKLTDDSPLIQAIANSAFQNLNDRNAVCYDPSGKLWIPGRTKVTCINPELYSSSIGFKPTVLNSVFLDINQVKARYSAAADFYHSYYNGRKGYEVPKGTGNHAMFASGVWIGGVSNQQLHIAAQTYRQSGNDFWPGPLDTITATCDSLTSKQWDKVWKVNKSDIDSFNIAFAAGRVTNGTYTIPTDILMWPAHGSGKQSRYLAPFVDVNQDGQYSPMNGDYPLIKGDQMLFWIVNDNTYIHSETNGKPLGAELHISAYAYHCPQPTVKGDFLNYTTFCHIKTINRSNRDYSDFYLSIWNDSDLGDYTDDYLGSNPKQHYTFFYNKDDWDSWYNAYPPIISNVFLNKPLTHAMSYVNDFSQGQGNPTNPQHYYNYMRSIWKDSTRLTYGVDGKTTGVLTNWIFPGNDDPSGLWNWTMMDTTLNLKLFDARIIASTSSATLPAGGTTELEYALVYTSVPGPRSHQDLLNQNEINCKNVRLWYTQNRLSTCGVSLANEDVSEQEFEINIYPNPSNGKLRLEATELLSGAEVNIFNSAGKVVLSSQLNKNGFAELDLYFVPSGVYWIKVLDGRKCVVQKWVKY